MVLTSTLIKMAYLTLILLSERKYVAAGKALIFLDRILKVTRSTTQTAVEALLKVATFEEINGDLSPDAAAIRMKALAILQRKVFFLSFFLYFAHLMLCMYTDGVQI